jgi:putative ABC transport system ATP-binding protein
MQAGEHAAERHRLMIRFDNISIHAQSHQILDGVSFEIAQGDRAVFFGPSGSGKTTILMCLIGGVVPTAGTVRFDGEVLSAQTLPQMRREVAFIGQEPMLGATEVREALLLPFTFRANRDRTPSEERVRQVLESLLLPPDILHKQTAVISGGEKQRLAVARALLLEKTIFVLDEVTSALDPQSRRAVMGLFTHPELTLLSVSHDPRWLALGNRFFKVEAGRVTEYSTPPVFHETVRQGGT